MEVSEFEIDDMSRSLASHSVFMVGPQVSGLLQLCSSNGETATLAP
jgi:hypothetical protein